MFLGASASALALGTAGLTTGTPSDSTADALAQFQFGARNTGHLDASPPEKYLAHDWDTGTYWGVFGTPAVVDGTIYVAMTEGNYGPGSGYAQALDAETGESQWTTDLAGKSETAPAVGDGTVYFGDKTAVHALATADGSVEWTFEKGATASPALVDGTLYVSAYDGVYALDAADGSVEWKQTDGYEGPTVDYGKSVASAPAVADGLVYVCNRDGTVLALDAASGDVQWRDSVEGMSAPTVADGTVYVGSGTVKALDAETGTVRWQRGYQDPEAGDAQSPNQSVAVHDGVVYSSANQVDAGSTRVLFAFDAETGEKRWKSVAPLGTFSGTPVVSGGHVYVWAETLVVLDTEDGSLVGQFASTRTSNGTGVVPTDDALYFGLSAYDVEGVGGGVHRLVADESAWNAPPKVELEASSTSVETGDSVTLSATGYLNQDEERYHDHDQEGVEYTWLDWNFEGDWEYVERDRTEEDGLPGITGEVELRNGDAGTYEMSVTIEDRSGWTASDSVTVEVGGGNDENGDNDGDENDDC